MLDYLLLRLSTFRADEDGQTAVEYALVLLLVALVLVFALAGGLGGALDSTITSIKNAL